MNNKDAIDKLKCATKDFNRALRTKVREKLNDFSGYNDVQTYRFDFDKADAEKITFKDVNSEKFLSDASETELEYYWIEYEEKKTRKKLAFFFKDVDCASHSQNIHVVPGLFEDLVYQKDHPTNMPYAIIDSETQKAVIKNASGYYPFFAEQDADGGWWCPSGKNRHVPLKSKKEGYYFPVNEAEIEAIDDFRAIYSNFAECELNAAKELANELNIVINNNLHKTIEMCPGNRTERYTPICWYDFRQTAYSLSFSNPIYFKNHGFLTQYNIMAFSKEGVKVRDIITNYPIVEEPADYKSVKARSLFKALSGENYEKHKADFESFLIATASGKED